MNFRNAGTYAFLVLIIIGTLAHVPEMWGIMRDKSVKTLAEFSAKVRKSLVSDFMWKNLFVDINGAYMRAIGHRVCNDVVRLPNGLLCGVLALSPSDEAIAKLPESAKRLGEFSSWLQDRGVPFLYVQAPAKMDMQGKLYPYYVKHSINEIPEIFCRELKSMGVNMLDLRPQLTVSPDDVKKNYFITDHHWTIDAAFAACPIIAERINHMLGIDGRLASVWFDPMKWSRFERKDWLLDSRGRRVGRFFAGFDDISWYEPKSESRMSCAIPSREIFRFGSFSDALIKKELLSEKRPDNFKTNPYLLYVGGVFPLVTHRNKFASTKARVLVIQDSYGVPLQPLFSTLYSEVDVLDLRYFNEMTVAEYVDITKPDAVVVMYYPISLLNSQVTSFGQCQTANVEWRCIQPTRQVRVEKSPRPYNYVNLTPDTGLRNGHLYKLVLSRGRSFDSSANCVTVCLHDLNSKKIMAMRVVDLDYINEKEECLGFKVPSTGKWRLLLYAGKRSATDVEADIGEVTLYEKK